MALIIYTVSMVVFSFYFEFTISSIVLRGLTGIGAFGALIGFCSKQANNHAKVKRHNRKMELELSSMSPFFAGYEKGELFEIKKELADRYFGTDDISSSKTNSEVDINQIKKVTGVINKIKST